MNYLTVEIYCLIDPRDGKPFYVGSSSYLCQRLYQHKVWAKKNPHTERGKKINDIILSGNNIKVDVFEIVPMDRGAKTETYYYDKLISEGYTLLQDGKRLFSAPFSVSSKNFKTRKNMFPKKAVTKKSKDIAISLREKGHTLQEIAKKMGYKNHNSITHLLKDKS